jgi:hypothetical protein
MKKTIVTLMVLLFAIAVYAAVDTWHSVDSTTIEWDASALSDGSPVPAGDVVNYFVYTKNPDGTNEKLIGNTDLLSYVVAVPADSKLYVGVSAQRVMADGTVLEETEINWSDVAEGNQDSITFGLSNILNILAPGGLRPQ